MEMEARSKSMILFVHKVVKNLKQIFIEESKIKNVVRELMDKKHELSELEISDEVYGLLTGGIDTSSIATSWTLVYLGLHKNIQEKVVAELKEVLGDDLFVDFDKITQLKYLEMVIIETLRLRPSLPIVMRKFTDEVVTSEGFTIPKHATAIIPIVSIHRNKKYWGDDANEFRPERFEDSSKIPQYAFLPFAKGPRMCIGERYTIISMKIVLAHFLMRYEVDSKMNLDDLDYFLGVTVNIKQGHMISIKKRQK